MNLRMIGVLVFALVGACAPVFSQLVLESKEPEPLQTPVIDLPKLYHLEWLTRPDNQTLKDNVDESEIGPFLSRKVLVRSATTVERSRTLGAGELGIEARKRPTLADRAHSSYEPIREFPERGRELAIMEAVFRHLIGFRKLGFAKDSMVQFVSIGDIAQDPPPDLVQRLNQLPEVAQDQLRVIPVSHALQPVGELILDRFSGESGPMYRISELNFLPDGSAEVVASFCEGSHFVFTKIYTLKNSARGWELTGERDFQVAQ